MGRKAIARTIERAGTDRLETENEIAEKRVTRTVRRSNVLLTMPERIAGDKFCYLNWKLPNASELFPDDWRLRFVAFHFPFAEGGPINFDMPKNEVEKRDCAVKAKVLRGLGFRYVIITNETTEAEAFEQLDKNHGMDNLAG